MADGNTERVQLRLPQGSEATVEIGGDMKAEFNSSTVIVNGVQVWPLANDNGLKAKAAPAASGEKRAIGTEEVSGWQYAGISPKTGKDFWMGTTDEPRLMNHFQAAACAEAKGARLMSSVEGKYAYNHQDELKGEFRKDISYWLAERDDSHARVQWFDVGVQNYVYRVNERPVRCVRDDLPLQR